MYKYAMVVDHDTKTCSVGMGNNHVFYENFGMELMDVEQGYDGQWYLAGYAPAEPEPTLEELAELIRNERDQQIAAYDWVMMRHRDEIDEGQGTTLNASDYAACLAYRKDLRNFPSLEGFPWDGGGDLTPWPVAPTL